MVLALHAVPLLLADALALVGGTVHTMVPGEEPRVATVLVVDGRVTAVGADLELPAGAVRYDATGLHVVPALVDAYVNFDAEHDALYTSAGVGLVRDVGGERLRLYYERDEANRARSQGPSLLTAGAILDGDPPSTRAAVVLRDVDAVEGLLPILLDEDVDFVSVFQGLTPEVHRRVVELADERGLEVWGPVPRALSLEEALEAGQDGVHFLDGLVPRSDRITWANVQPPAFDGPAARLAARSEDGSEDGAERAAIPVVPLLHANALRLENQAQNPVWERIFRLLNPTYELWWRSELSGRAQRLEKERELLAEGQRVIAKQAIVLKRLYDAGVHLLPGSGAPQPWLLPGHALHRELALWVRAGIPAYEVLELATRRAAEALCVAEDHGSIAPGVVGNLVVVASDPREGLDSLAEPQAVVVRGEVLDRERLLDMLDTLEKSQTELRAELAKPVELEPPPIPEGAALVLEGRVENQSMGVRLSTERFRVARLPGETLVFSGRLLFAKTGDTPAREMVVTQTTEKGELSRVDVRLQVGEEVLRHEGIWVANQWRMRRVMAEQQVDARTSRERPVCADLGSVTTLLVLAQAPLSARFPIVTFHDGLNPESAMWGMELDHAGQHQVRTHLGQLAFRLDDLGAPELAATLVGGNVIETIRVGPAEAFGGPGLPLPPAKAAAVEAARAAGRAAEAGLAGEAGPGDEATGEAPPTPSEPGGSQESGGPPVDETSGEDDGDGR